MWGRECFIAQKHIHALEKFLKPPKYWELLHKEAPKCQCGSPTNGLCEKTAKCHKEVAFSSEQLT